MNQDRVDAVAREIRRYYLERKNSIYNNKFKLSPKHSEFVHWQRAAVVCMELNAVPEVFVDAAFKYCNITTGPFPNAMYGQCARKWYAAYMAGRKDLVQAHETAKCLGLDPSSDPNSDMHVVTLRNDIDFVKRSLYRLKGNDRIDNTAMLYIESLMVSYPPHVRVLFGFKNEKIKNFFGKEAYQYYMQNPGMFYAAETLGFPIKEIISWLNAPTH